MEAFIQLNYFSADQPQTLKLDTYFKSCIDSTFELFPFFSALETAQMQRTTGLIPENHPELPLPFQSLHFDQDTPKQHLLDRFFEERDEQQVCFEMQFQQLNEANSQLSQQQLLRLARAAFAGTPTDLAGHILKFYSALILAKNELEARYEAIKAYLTTFLTYLASHSVSFPADFETLFRTNFVCFPRNLVIHLASKIAQAALDPLTAIDLLETLPNFKIELAETYFFVAEMRPKAAALVAELLGNALYGDSGRQSLLRTLQGEISGDFVHFEQAAALDPQNARAHRDMGSFYLTNYQQKETDIPQQKKLIQSAICAFTRAYEIDPADVACRENLGQLLLLTRQNLGLCQRIFESLDAENQQNSKIQQNLAMCAYATGDKKQALELYFQALKSDSGVDLSINYQMLLLASETRELEPAKVHYVLSSLINRFNLHLQKNSWKSDTEKVTYAMNFMWHVTKPVVGLLNELLSAVEASASDQKRRAQPISQLLDSYLEFVRKFAGTQAGDECVLSFVQVKNRVDAVKK
ncbi:hypothetical protein SS50377_23938 [Spironucleus salmonicida]|uniref:Tetratricopeptide repeat protein n=1 Tax=Spironucleus salmonicida TaxID=348837 RepID=V6LX85_9EUKA|nr:hypothetical protein SS50377_23938 [Spironucleus salmonicida]|eukprot:EST48331.1 Hypothetical protein SS50377_11535 [Spironucleus salmonicida]